jgi:hypothetical protein
LLQQVKQLASKGQDAQTTAQVNQYVDSNQDIISAILKNYVDYAKQLQSLADDGEAPPPPSHSSQTSYSSQTSQPSAGTSQQTTAVQSSTALQITGVQASGGLQTSHLAGYPALPEVDPTTTVTQPTEYSIRVQKELRARKQSLMAAPGTDTN